MKNANGRKGLLAQIHIGRKALGLDDDSYRDMLEAATGKRSCADMRLGELVSICMRLEKIALAQGVELSKPKHPGKPANMDTDGKGPLLGKIEALLAEGKRPWSYAHGIAKRMYGSERVEWLTSRQLGSVVTALVKAQQKRKEAAA
ncbi:Mu-like prophage protein gp16 [Desulfonatronum thiosulfatophilum]|uniref:Mu-like prophage protein gp16 n=1 Tax=Desulfonatronum thiosulfatophilum TaxID=617002 RepID=A0A1G6A608_9BACT|nr:regulatory protein GemA [Desulfonatronum thiosulfatophilum]SDB03463.1 Mu-like prophage protein gp16 [Desulfonatronum thiosulfatophilum]